MARVLTLTGPREVVFAEEDHERTLKAGEVRLRGLLSGISHATELNLYRGTSPFGDRVFDTSLRAFVPSDGSREAFPIRMGYEIVSEVVEVGQGVEGVSVGDTVHTGTPHQDWAIVELEEILEFGYPLTVLPAGESDLRPGLFVSLASVALQAVHDGRIKVSDAVVVSGLGVIGLLVVQLAVRNGADPVIAIDPLAPRRELAERYGALTLDPADSDAVGATVKRMTSRRGVDVAIETSGVAAGLHAAIASVVVGGRVVSVGFYQGDAVGLRLGEEWHHNRPTMVSSMGVWGCPHRDHPAWDRQRMMDTAVNLLFRGGLETDTMLSCVVPFETAPDAYRLLDQDAAAALKIGLAFPGSEQFVTRDRALADLAMQPSAPARHG